MRILAAFILLFGTSLISGCGGGGSQATDTQPIQPVSISFASTPPASLNVNATYSLAATVSNGSSALVNWSVTCGSAGACGSFNLSQTSSGISTTYTAPAAIPAGATVTITASSVADSTKSVSAVITITTPAPPAPISVSFFTYVPPSSMPGGATVVLEAWVHNDTASNSQVQWSVTCDGGQCGLITPTTTLSMLTSTEYTAPFSAPPGNTVTVTATSVTDPTKSVSATITITGQLPVANTGGPYTGYYDTPLTFNGSGSSDPRGELLMYSWNFGDNTATGTGVAPTHTYTGSGPYNVTLTVTDTSGLFGSASTTVTLGWPPPTVNIHGPYTGAPMLPVDFTSTVTDPLDNNWTYYWQFGDGGTSSAANPQHTYATTGTYNVSLYVVGQYNDSDTTMTTATIRVGDVGSGLSGIVQSGNVPVVGAHVYLYAANTTGYGQPSVSLLSGTGYSDANGAYMLSGSDGTFMLPSGFSCVTNEQVYVYALGGTVGTNANPGAGLLSVVGACGYLNVSTYVTVNEVSTVAAAYAISGYATGPTHVSSPNTTAALTGIGNAFLNASNLASAANGVALAVTPPGNGTAPQMTVNTLANILNACVSAAANSTACATLFANAESGGSTGTVPADTATAMINIAHNQGANMATLYALMSAEPFKPVLTTAPHDWTMGISFTGVYQSEGLAVDGAGDVWVLQYPSTFGLYPMLSELASNGNLLLRENTTCSAGTEAIPAAISVDTNGDVWLLVNAGASAYDSDDNEYAYYLVSYCTVSSAGGMLSPPGGYVLGGDSTPNLVLFGLANDGSGNGWIPSTTLLEMTLSGNMLESYVIGNAPVGAEVAIDGSGNFWVTSQSTNGIVKLSPSGTLLSPANGYTGGGLYQPGAIAIDNAGNAWATNTVSGYIYTGTSISKLSSNGTPLSGSGFTNNAMSNPYALAIDGSGNVWIANGYDYEGDNSVLELSPSGTLSMSINHTNSAREYLNGPQSIAVDSAGNVWFSDGDTNTVTEFLGVATPVVTPLAANLQPPYNAPASKP